MANENIFQLKRSLTSTNVPGSSSMQQGELAINLADNRLFTKNGSNTIIDVFGQSLNTTANVEFNKVTVATDVVISGNLTINGDTVTINAGSLEIADESIVLNSDHSGAPSQNVGFVVNRGDAANAVFEWDEGTDRWAFSDGFISGDLEVTGNLVVTAGELVINDLDVTQQANFSNGINISNGGITFADGSYQDKFLDPIVYAIALG